MEETIYRVYDIEWDIDEDDKDKVCLPCEVRVNEDDLDKSLTLEEALSEYITEKYGFCHNGFNYEDYIPPKSKTIEGDYFILVEEWNYPTESGREPVEVTFDGSNLEDALSYAHIMVADEEDNFRKSIKQDVGNIDMFDDNSGYIITSKMGLDPYYYAVRIIGLKKVG